MNGKHYALVISAGKKKVVANPISGEKFTGGGVTMRVAITAKKRRQLENPNVIKFHEHVTNQA